MRHLAISAIGRDHPGIVATVTQVLLDNEVNVEDSQMTILRGRFTMMLIVSGPDDLDVDALRAGLDGAARELGLDAVSVDEVEPPSGESSSEPSHIVTVYGVDHPGIVNAVAAALAGADVNITDLNTRLVSDDPRENGDGADDLYAMMLEVALPEGLSASALQTLLEATRRDQDVDVTIRELESDEL
jgi:glycine cleavage system transcriptional repressor